MMFGKTITSPFVWLSLIFATANAVSDKSKTWNYVYGSDSGPANWGSLTSIQNNECGGNAQSPIDITTHSVTYISGACEAFMDYEMRKGNCTYEQVKFKISDHNIEVEYKDESCTKDILVLPDIPNEEFELIQFHIHTGTEHSFDGLVNAAELHLVHRSKSDSSTLAVVGFMIQVGLAQDNFKFKDLLDGFQKTASEVEDACANVTAVSKRRRRLNRGLAAENNQVLDIYDFIPANETYYRYEGSLTTPPCSEIVHWSVASRPIQISSTEEVDLVELILEYIDPETCEEGTTASNGGSTSRPQQPLNGRAVTHICPKAFEELSNGDGGGGGASSWAATTTTSALIFLVVAASTLLW